MNFSPEAWAMSDRQGGLFGLCFELEPAPSSRYESWHSPPRRGLPSHQRSAREPFEAKVPTSPSAAT